MADGGDEDEDENKKSVLNEAESLPLSCVLLTVWLLPGFSRSLSLRHICDAFHGQH